jgi:hypothetical protein
MTQASVVDLLSRFGVSSPQVEHPCTAHSTKLRGHPRVTSLNCTGGATMGGFELGFIVTSVQSASRKLAAATGTNVTLFISRVRR